MAVGLVGLILFAGCDSATTTNNSSACTPADSTKVFTVALANDTGEDTADNITTDNRIKWQATECARVSYRIGTRGGFTEIIAQAPAGEQVTVIPVMPMATGTQTVQLRAQLSGILDETDDKTVKFGYRFALYEAQWGSMGTSTTQLNSPRGVAVSNGTIYVADFKQSPGTGVQ